MSGHTNRNRRNGGNSRSRHGPQRSRGADSRANQPKNAAPPGAEQQALSGEQKPAHDNKRADKPDHKTAPGASHPTAEPAAQGDAAVEPPLSNGEGPTASASDDSSGETTDGSSDDASELNRQDSAASLPRPPFAASSRGGHAYIPASGPRLNLNGQNGQHGQNGQNGRHAVNGHKAAERRVDPADFTTDDADSGGDGLVPANWRIERLNGGTDTTPREPFRPESRGEVGSLIDSLHAMFAQDRAVASRGDSARCGICYLHFPLTSLEYREVEGFFVCTDCKRTLGHQQVMMIRRQQSPYNG